MTTIAKPPDANLDTLARDYIQSLRQGRSVDRLDDFGPWESTISNIERACFRAHGDLETIQRIIDNLSNQDRQLYDLLNPPPSIEDILKEIEPAYPPLPDHVQLPPDLARGACQFLDEYEKFSRAASPEAYDDFHVFCGLWILSVAAARRVYFGFGRKRIFPNLMIAMCARTSLFAKSSTAQVAKDLLIAAGLSYLIGPDRTSPAKLLSDMSGSHIPNNYDELSIEKQERIKKRLAMSGQRGLFFDEFGKFVQAMLRRGSTTSDFAELFMTLDACPEEYENTTIARGGEPIQKPYLPLLGAMTPANLKENAKSGADFWTDGFWARFSFIAAPPNEYKDAPLEAEEIPIPRDLIQSLRNWHIILGVPQCDIAPILDKSSKETGRYTIERDNLPEHKCSIDPEAFSAWKRYRSALKKMISGFKHEDFNGSYQRLAETALRMAILMASLENQNHITIRHWAKAQELAEILRKNLHELYKQVNTDAGSNIARAEEQILEKLQQLSQKGVRSITVAQLKGCYLKSFSLNDLREIMDNLVKVGLLKKEQTAHAKTGKYALADQS